MSELWLLFSLFCYDANYLSLKLLLQLIGQGNRLLVHNALGVLAASSHTGAES